MKCPKCGYVRQASDNQFAPATECPACGVVYSKTGTDGNGAPLDAGSIKKPSPVNEESLKRARDRVEKRLRKKMGPDQDETRREQTLQRARIFAADGVRQRQEAWKRRKAGKKDQPDDLTMSEAAIRVKDPTVDLTGFKGGNLTMFGVIRPDMAADEAAGQESETGPERGGDANISLSDSLANRPPGDDLAHDTQPAYPELTDVKPGMERTKAPDAVHDAHGKTGPPQTESATETDGDTVRAEALQRQEAPTVIGETAPAPKKVKARPAAEKADIEGAAGSDEAQPIAHHEPAPPDDEDQPEMPAHIAHATGPRTGRGLMGLLPTVAWLVLTAGLVGAVLSWTTMNDVQAGQAGSAAIGSGAVPIALLLGFAYLATGVLGFAFFWVCSMISRQLRNIQETLEIQAAPPEKEEKSA